MKRITISDNGWLTSLPTPHTRPYVVENVFSLGQKHGWTIALSGTHWGQ